MSRLCRRIRRTLEEAGPHGLREDAVAQEHLAQCETCFEALEAAGRLAEALAGLEPLDAPDEVVEQLLARVREDEAAPEATRTGAGSEDGRSAGSRFLPWALGAGQWLWSHRAREVNWASAATVVIVMATGGMALWLGGGQQQDVFSGGDSKVEQLRFRPLESPEGGKEATNRPNVASYRGEARERLQAEPGELATDGGAAEDGRITLLRPSSGALADKIEVGGDVSRRQSTFAKQGAAGQNEGAGFELDLAARVTREDVHAGGPRKKAESSSSPGSRAIFGAKSSGERKGENEKAKRRVVGQAAKPDRRVESIQDNLASLGYLDSSVALDSDLAQTEERPLEVAYDEQNEGDARVARAFLELRARVDGLTFQDARGYWSNQYVPGDPVFRLLQSRLLGRERAALEGYKGGRVALHDAAHQAAQPFDPPNGAALAVYLEADRGRLHEPGRVLLQVGLQATERRSGRRPALNLAVVLDLRGEIDAATASAFRALATALEDSRDLGDRFQLLVAGRPGGLLVGPQEFRHGPLTVALEQVLGVGGSTARTLELPEALALAVSKAHEADDPTAPLGSSAVVLVTSAPLGSSLGSLERLAHESAVAGVPVSVVGVGSRIERGELDRIALAGQGNRRLMSAPAEAAGLVDRELSAVGRLVARALRLRIRLAPGVELVAVLGSQRLDATRAEAVREAELSLDLRMARDLGIEADRGEDEEGIQIVIPNFYAGDAHVVLLDVVVPGPGPVADVTVRYKDLVHLRNGVARDHLALARGESTVEPLGLNVLKNLLALGLFESLEKAGHQLAAGDLEAATQTLEQAARLLRGVQHEVAGLAQDRDLTSDVAMLEEYVSLLGAGAGAEPTERQHLVDSLRLAGRLKILPQPVVDR